MKEHLEMEKQLAAKEAVKFIKDNQTVGLGTGSTAYYAIVEIGKLINRGLKIKVVPTSTKISNLAKSLNIPLIDIKEVTSIDVFVRDLETPIAFEIQLSPQSLAKTLVRQSKYIRDCVTACWLFENPVPKLINERPDLPVFYVDEAADSSLHVNLGTRRKLPIRSFLENFIAGRIQFKEEIQTSVKQSVDLVFYEMQCWKCKETNHLYFIDNPFYSSCGAKIIPDEALWDSSSAEYFPEIVELAKKIAADRKDLNLRLATIKERHSYTVDQSYTSFGCLKCDSIFGDFYVMQTKIDQIYGPKDLMCSGKIELNKIKNLPIPHWCFPDDKKYCCK